MALVKFDRGRNSGMDRWMNDFLSPVFEDSFLGDRFISRVPAVNISEDNDSYHIELAAPGLSKGDFKINVDGDILSVSAEKSTENTDSDKKYSKREYSYTSFTRSFTLPESIDQGKIDANYSKGVLSISVGKREEAKKVSRLIEVK